MISQILPFRILYSFLLILALLISSSCSDQLTEEEQIEQYVTSASSYAESRNLRKLKKIISNDYNDKTKRTKRDITAILAGYFMRNSNFHLLTRVEEVVLNDKNNATATVFVAISTTKTSMDDMEIAQAIFHAFDIHLIKDSDDWLLSSAKWQPSNMETFIRVP